MEDLEILPAPTVTSAPAERLPWHEEEAAYWRLHNELLKTHENKYVAILHGRVVVEGEDRIDVSERALRQFGNVPMFIHQVTSAPPKPKRIYTPRKTGKV